MMDKLREICEVAECSVEIDFRPEGRRWKWIAYIWNCPGKPSKPIYGETLEDLVDRGHQSIDWTKKVRP